MLRRLQTNTTRTPRDIFKKEKIVIVSAMSDACEQTTNMRADVALGLQIILAELPYRAVDDALRDAEGLEEVLEEAAIPVACHRQWRKARRCSVLGWAPLASKKGERQRSTSDQASTPKKRDCFLDRSLGRRPFFFPDLTPLFLASPGARVEKTWSPLVRFTASWVRLVATSGALVENVLKKLCHP